MADSIPNEERIEPTQHMMEEAHRILTVAKERNIILKLAGGWGIHEHCTVHDFCDREHPDIDFVGTQSQYQDLVRLMEDIGYMENLNMTMATKGSRLLFEKLDSKDHIDVFLDFMEMEHRIDLRGRLEIEEDTLSVSDLLLMKAIIAQLNEKDIRDIITMMKDLFVGEDDSPGTINKDYIAKVCSKRWGLHHDVLFALKKTQRLLPQYSFPAEVEELVTNRLQSIIDAIVNAPKTLRWKLRALLGERVPWRRIVESGRVVVDTSQKFQSGTSNT